MDIVEAIRSRRAAKAFSSDTVGKDTLVKLVDLARHSPSGGNKNAWRFVVITSRTALDRLSETHPHCKWFSSAPSGMAIAIDPKATRYWLEDCSVAAYAIWLAATGMGLAVAWSAMHQAGNQAESERRQRLVREVLAIPEELYVPVVLGIGFHASPPPPGQRPELETLVSWEAYGQK
ncbi:MAG: nitroreductase family protein [Chloroflexi bacterium]|nr:nitroreductase family protein [Chloroflexota bacterium]